MFLLSSRQNYEIKYKKVINPFKFKKNSSKTAPRYDPIFLAVLLLSIKFIAPIQKPEVLHHRRGTGNGKKFRPDTMKNDIHLAPPRPSFVLSAGDLTSITLDRSHSRSRASSPRLIESKVRV